MTTAAERKAKGFLATIGATTLEILQILGEAVMLLIQAIRRTRLTRATRARILTQIVRIGSDTVPLAFLVSLFVGMVLVVQTADQLQQFTQSILGSIVGLAMTKEMGPVMIAFLITGRAGSAIAAEIGSMRVYDEINALRTMDIDPVHFLVVPRLIAMIVALPMLVIYADVVGIAGGALVVALDPAIRISVDQYLENLTQWINAADIVVGLLKAVVFAVIIAIVSCAFGFRTTGGARGVALSTTASVVWSFVLIIILDFFIVRAALLWSS